MGDITDMGMSPPPSPEPEEPPEPHRIAPPRPQTPPKEKAFVAELHHDHSPTAVAARMSGGFGEDGGGADPGSGAAGAEGAEGAAPAAEGAEGAEAAAPAEAAPAPYVPGTAEPVAAPSYTVGDRVSWVTRGNESCVVQFVTRTGTVDLRREGGAIEYGVAMGDIELLEAWAEDEEEVVASTPPSPAGSPAAASGSQPASTPPASPARSAAAPASPQLASGGSASQRRIQLEAEKQRIMQSIEADLSAVLESADAAVLVPTEQAATALAGASIAAKDALLADLHLAAESNDEAAMRAAMEKLNKIVLRDETKL